MRGVIESRMREKGDERQREKRWRDSESRGVKEERREGERGGEER